MAAGRIKKLIAVLQWDLKYTAKDAEEFRRLARAAVKRKQPIPDYVVMRPELLRENQFWFVAYCELQAHDFSFSECRDYANHYGVSFEQLRYIMRIMWGNRNGV